MAVSRVHSLEVEEAPAPTSTLFDPDEIVSTALVDGAPQVLSRFRDRRWLLTTRTTNVRQSGSTLDFGVLPECFRADMKVMILSYQRCGRRGRTPPSSAWLCKVFMTARPFLRHLVSCGVSSFSEVTSEVCLTYVEACRRARARRRDSLLALGTLELRFLTVEVLFDLSHFLKAPFAEHPWPESGARVLAGRVGENAPSAAAAKTHIIPDEILASLFQASHEAIQDADRLLDIRDKLEAIRGRDKSPSGWKGIVSANALLDNLGWEGGVRRLKKEIGYLRTACYIVIASVSGCRNHEIAHLTTGCYFSTVDEDGDRFWWIRSKTSKTRRAECDWLVPPVAIEAIKTLERWAEPYQADIREEIAALRRISPRDPRLSEIRRHESALFLSGHGARYRTMTAPYLDTLLPEFAQKHSIAWSPKTHQFRRTFAVYAARSNFGDLRYLKEHFKHWSIDMTLLYAANEQQENDLYAEVFDVLDEMREGLVGQWLRPDSPLSGGAGRRITWFRGNEPIAMRISHRDLIRTVSEGVHIRSTGHGWCTADSGIGCVGSGTTDETRCSQCTHGVIGLAHSNFYLQMYRDLQGLLRVDDIGEAGLIRVRRDLERCRLVLSDLGINVPHD